MQKAQILSLQGRLPLELGNLPYLEEMNGRSLEALHKVEREFQPESSESDMNQPFSTGYLLLHRLKFPDPATFTLFLSILLATTVLRFQLKVNGKFLRTEEFQQKEILRFTVGSNKIKIRAIIEKEDGMHCGGRSGGLVRKDFVFCFFRKSLEDYCAKTSVNILIW
ncbi:hypothetical protein Pint_10264 [Pistacia integerrima]|uniref:Uncharacterized protein n=1 Tax=Pistacia integerrima TaxID=434235 RepID=A0ACC0XMY0_9ROSI|nr:hypothetical protein Pint_10264 [Pistacia integerrima]